MIDIPVADLKNRIADLHVLTQWITIGHFTSYHALNHAILRHIVLTLNQGFDGLTVTDDSHGVRYIFNLI